MNHQHRPHDHNQPAAGSTMDHEHGNRSSDPPMNHSDMECRPIMNNMQDMINTQGAPQVFSNGASLSA